MEKVSYKELRSAVVTMDNSVDTERVYEISANVNVQMGNTVGTIDNGVVRTKGEENNSNIATFNAWSDKNKNVSYNNADDECEVLMAINAFIADCKAKVAESGVVDFIV